MTEGLNFAMHLGISTLFLKQKSDLDTFKSAWHRADSPDPWLYVCVCIAVL